ncbi:putative enoyl-CoA hydratase/isomerase YngF [Adelges cooleyi]|uniref:putative enoyl-CoA hydratase/isomerase YngF n=1 Tax=Adelges cooleyi TaxID=133065 RepID=UPI00217F63E2|nr:putative enoyl-CoA hydratase/isomerase YngF [Adelges cooleyi]
MFNTPLKYNYLIRSIHKSNTFKQLSKNIQSLSTDIHDYPDINVSKHQHITLIALNRPDDKNKLNTSTIDSLQKAVRDFENNDSSTVAVLYGEGGSFCAGYEPDESIESYQKYNEFIKSYCQKPIIAAISGFAYNVGFDLSLWCDLRIVEENAVMAVDRKSDALMSEAFFKRLSVSIGYSRAIDLILTGRDICSKEAFECGLANRVVACGSSVGQAVNMAYNIGKFSIESINRDRKMLQKCLDD